MRLFPLLSQRVLGTSPRRKGRSMQRIALVMLALVLLLLLGSACGEDREPGPDLGRTQTPADTPGRPTQESAVEPTARATAAERPEPTPTEVPQPTPQLHGIWAYCADVGTSLSILEDPPDAVPGYVYRCYQGKPLYCVMAPTGGDCARLSRNEAEPQALADYCRDNPDETWAPYALTGDWPQMYQWSCQDGRAVRVEEPLFDPQDFDDADFYIPAWQEVPKP
jgi:hypothetical protein